MIKISGINTVVWKYSKSNYQYNSYEELLDQLQQKFNVWLEQDFSFSEREIVEIVYQCYCDYAQHGIPIHLNVNFFTTLIGDNVIEMVYGKDTRPLNQRIIEGVIIALRNAQVYDFNNKKLIDFGE